MESADNNGTGSHGASSSARRSGRVTKAPEKFNPDAPGAIKRKRANEHDDEDVENESPGVDEPESEDGEEESAAEDDAGQRKKKRSQAKKPAAKKPKINGDAADHATRLPTRTKKAVRIAIEGRQGDGLYGELLMTPTWKH
jgi:cohesin complex subunit SA-1/2